MKNKNKAKIKLLLWCLLLLAVLSFLTKPLWSSRSISSEEIHPTHGDLTTYYSFAGSVEAKNRETVFADKAMQVKEIKVKKGEAVKKDHVLMTTTRGEKILAGIDGEVAEIYAEENAQLMPGAKLADIVDYSDLRISVKVDEYDLGAVTEGKEAAVTIHALSKDVKGTIESISKEGTYTISR